MWDVAAREKNDLVLVTPECQSCRSRRALVMYPTMAHGFTVHPLPFVGRVLSCSYDDTATPAGFLNTAGRRCVNKKAKAAKA